MPTRKLNDIERLYEELIGPVPKKKGTAYEKLTAIVLAALGWQDVIHDRTEQAEGMLADHQLDVTCRNADGSVERVLIECKDWDTEDIGQDEMIKLYSVRDELGASHAAMITKRRFTEGARATAVDHDIAMLRLRIYDPAIDDGTWITGMTITWEFGVPVQEDVEVRVDGNWQSAQELGMMIQGWMDVVDPAGDPVDTIAGLFAAGEIVDEQDGRTRRQVDLPQPRQLEGFAGWLSFDAMRWTERVVTDTVVSTSKASGTPRLLLQQLDENGDAHAGRVMVDEKLTPWRVNDDGTVSPLDPPGLLPQPASPAPASEADSPPAGPAGA